jgi:hypothetical protein
METRTVHDPFTGQDVQVSNRLVDRLRGKYASGPHLPNGRPEFGWRQFEAPPIQHEAANRMEELEIRVAVLETAARVVTSFDWSDNDEDAVRVMDALRNLVGR